MHACNYIHSLLPLQVTVPECGITVEERFGHSATAVPINPSLIEVTIFGGCLDLEFIIAKAEDLQIHIPGTIVLKFGMLPGTNTVLSRK
jgi:hypothetical protein